MIPVICCFARCFVATGGESSTLFLLDQREGERDGVFLVLGVALQIHFCT